MNEFLKKGFFLGLGIAAASKEKVEKYVRELVEKGKLTPKEADDVIQTFIKKGEETEEKWDERRKIIVRSTMSDCGLATKEEVHELEDRIVKLEMQIRQLLDEKNVDSKLNDSASSDVDNNDDHDEEEIKEKKLI